MTHNAFLILGKEMKIVHEINQQKLLTAFDGKVRTFYKIEVPAVQRMPPVALCIVNQLFIVELRCANTKRVIAVQGCDIEMAVLKECSNQRVVIRREVPKGRCLRAIINPAGNFLKNPCLDKLLQMAIYGF